jgi:hypothetical protein
MTIYWYFQHIKLQGNMFQPEFSHIQAISLHKNKLQLHINLRLVRRRSQSLVITTHTCSLSVQNLKTIKISDTLVRYQYYFQSEESQKKNIQKYFCLNLYGADSRIICERTIEQEFRGSGCSVIEVLVHNFSVGTK